MDADSSRRCQGHAVEQRSAFDELAVVEPLEAWTVGPDTFSTCTTRELEAYDLTLERETPRLTVADSSSPPRRP